MKPLNWNIIPEISDSQKNKTINNNDKNAELFDISLNPKYVLLVIVKNEIETSIRVNNANTMPNLKIFLGPSRFRFFIITKNIGLDGTRYISRRVLKTS